MAEVGADGTFACGEISAAGLPVGEGSPSEDDLFASLNCQKGELAHACLHGAAWRRRWGCLRHRCDVQQAEDCMGMIMPVNCSG